MDNLTHLIELLSSEEFLYPNDGLTTDGYIELIEKKAVEVITKHRVLTAGDEARIGFYIRAKALDEEISKFECGVALVSLTVSVNEQIKGESSVIVVENMRMKGCRTVGEFLFFTGPAGERIVRHSDLTELFRNEFNKLWRKQASYNPSTYSEKLKKNISGIIFRDGDQ